MANIKFDLSQTVRQVEALGQAAGTLVGTLEQAMSRLSQLQSSMPVAAQAAGGGHVSAGPVPPRTGLTDQYSDLRKQLTDQMQEALEKEPNYLEWKKRLGRGQAHVNQSGMVGFTGGGGVLPLSEIDKGLELANQARAQMDSAARSNAAGAIGSAYNRAVNTNTPTSQATNYHMVTGRDGQGRMEAPIMRNMYSAGVKAPDITRVMGDATAMQKNLSGIEDSLRKMRDSDDKRERMIANELSRSVTMFESIGKSIEKHNQKLDSPDLTTRQREVIQEKRRRATGRLREEIENIEDYAEQARIPLGGDGGGTGRMSRAQKLARGIGVGMGALGGMATAATSLLGAQQVIDRATLGGEIDTAINRGQARGIVARERQEMHDMTRAENVLRYGADMIMPGRKFNFIGKEGLDRATGVAIEEVGQMRGIQRRQQLLETIGAGTQIGLSAMETGMGAVTTVGTGGLSSMIGAGFMSQGIQGVSSGLGQLAQARYGNPYAAYSGALSESRTAALLGGPGFAEMARWAQQREVSSDLLRVKQRARSAGDAELSGLANESMSLQRLLDIEGAEKTAVPMIGGAATLSRGDVSKMFYAPSSAAIRTARSNLNKAASEQVTAEISAMERMADIERLAGGEPIGVTNGVVLRSGVNGKVTASRDIEAYGKDIMNNLSAGIGFSAKNARMVGNRGVTSGMAMGDAEFGFGIGEKISEINKDVAAARQRTITARDSFMKAQEQSGVTTPFERLEMSQSEFVIRHAQTMNALNLRDSDKGNAIGLTERIVRSGRAGLGSVDQIMGNLSSIAKISGASGEENYGKLRQIMEASIQAGFDKSRTGQAFIQTSIGIADSLKLRNVEEAAGLVGGTARMLSLDPTKKANEFALASAAQGIQSLASFTGQTGGYMGALKMQNILATGAPTYDVIMTAGTDLVKTQQQINMIGTSAGDINKVSDEQLKGQIDAAYQENLKSGMGKRDAMNKAFKQSRKRLEANRKSVYDMFRQGAQGVQVDIEGDINDIINESRTGMGKEYASKVRAMTYKLKGAFKAMGADESAAGAFLYQLLQSQDKKFIGGKTASALGQKEAEGQAVYTDVANQGMIRFTDNIIRNMDGAISSSASVQQYQEYLSKGGRAMRIKGEVVTKRMLNDAFSGDGDAGAQASLMKAFDIKGEEFEKIKNIEQLDSLLSNREGKTGISGLDLVRGASELTGIDAVPQNVNITNIDDFANALEKHINKEVEKRLSGEKDPTSGADSGGSFFGRW